MKRFAFGLLVICTCAALTACGNRKGSSSPKVDPAVVAAKKAKSDAIMATAQPVDIQGSTFRVGHSPDKKYALVGNEAGQNVNGFVLELAATRATGCDAVFEGGVLKYAPSFTNLTNIPLKDAGRLRVETYCEGDTRNRLTGLPDGLPGSKFQAEQHQDYPATGKTYLTFSPQHGFQVSYVANGGVSWLWYPGNAQSLRHDFHLTDREICFRPPANSYNPATKQSGDRLECTPLSFARRLIVAALDRDPYDLSRGSVPFRRKKCDAPAEFEFDRDKVGC